MKKTLSLALVFIFVAQFVTLPVQALEIVINSNGTTYFYEDQVLEERRERKMETKADGLVVYKTKAEKVKKILGFINRTVETEVELDDQTGEITEKEVPVSNWFSRLLNSMAN